MTVSVDEFRGLLKAASEYDIVKDVLLKGPAKHVSEQDIEYIRNILAASYAVDKYKIRIVITGSAKLGFSLCEKKVRGSQPLPRYRSFSAQSDIDVAVICDPIFDKLWLELAKHYSSQPWFPPNTGNLGHYLAVGWLRPDFFPKYSRLPFCDNWFSTFGKISRNTRFGRRRVNGGTFRSEDHLIQYLARSVRDCIALEVSP